MPKRIQRRNTKGWRKPEGAVYVGRGSKWSNPYKPGNTYTIVTGPYTQTRLMTVRVESMEDAARLYRVVIKRGWSPSVAPSDEVIRRELAGHDLMCWCPLDAPCHADVLLDIANPEETK